MVSGVYILLCPQEIHALAHLPQFPSVQHCDAVCILYGTESMCYHQNGSALADSVQSLLDQLLRVSIQSTRGLVQNEDAWVLEQRPRYRDPLLLSARHGVASLSYHSAIAIWECTYEVVSIGVPGCFIHLIGYGSMNVYSRVGN